MSVHTYIYEKAFINYMNFYNLYTKRFPYKLLSLIHSQLPVCKQTTLQNYINIYKKIIIYEKRFLCYVKLMKGTNKVQ